MYLLKVPQLGEQGATLVSLAGQSTVISQQGQQPLPFVALPPSYLCKVIVGKSKRRSSGFPEAPQGVHRGQWGRHGSEECVMLQTSQLTSIGKGLALHRNLPMEFLLYFSSLRLVMACENSLPSFFASVYNGSVDLNT